jgi:hypothetical protein
MKRGADVAEEGAEHAAREGAERAAREGSEALDDISPPHEAKNLDEATAPPCPVAVNCFVAGTLVATSEGLLPIEQIQPGDQVYAYDDATGEEHLAEVVALHHRDVEATWVLEVGGETIETTDEHPFYVAGQGWTEAKDLQAGDLLVTEGGDRRPLDKIERVEGNARVYNFEVRDLHSYFVGTVGAVVHNCVARVATEQGRDAAGKFLPKDGSELAPGAGRAQRVEEKLESRFGQDAVQSEQYLRNSDGKIAVDAATGEARRLDFVVVTNGQARYSIEVTSKTASKTRQLAKEARIRKAGGTFIQDRVTGKLIDLKNLPTRTVRVR